MITKGTATYKKEDDQEMSMEEILASIRKYVTDDEASSLSPLQGNVPMETRPPKSGVLDLSDVKLQKTPVYAHDVNTPSHSSLDESYDHAQDTHDPLAGAPMTHSHANHTMHNYAAPQAVPSASNPYAAVHSPFGAAAAPIYPHQVYGGNPQVHPVTAEAMMQHQTHSVLEMYPAQPSMHPTAAPYGAQGMPGNIASASEQSLSKLIEAAKITQAHMEKAAAVAASSHSLENIALHAMGPQIKAWLDEHLPAVVERLVEKEIKRLTETLLKV